MAILVSCSLLLACLTVEEQAGHNGRRDGDHAKVTSSPSVQGHKVTEISASDYWFFKSLDLLYKVTETDDAVTGLYQDMHGGVPFTFSKDALEDRWARTEGTVFAVERLIVTVEHSRDPRQAASMMDRLTSLTNQPFASAEKWRAWFNENRDYLVWSDQKGALVVDEEAKEKGIPAVEYRQDKSAPRNR